MLLPNDTQHHAIFGTNGSGKTVWAAYMLSGRSFHRMPWIAIDSKRDPLIAQIPGLEEIGVDARLPRSKGLYCIRPDPDDFESGAVSAFLTRAWQRENIGLWIDEGYAFKPTDRALQAILTQGRSKHTPAIVLAQRPAYVSHWLMSESTFFSVFYTPHPRDVDRLREWIPGDIRPEDLPPHHSYWYCRTSRELHRFKPGPDEATILQIFADRRVRRGWI